MQGKLLVRNRSGGAKLLAGLTKRGALRRSCPPAAFRRLLLYFAMQNTRLLRTRHVAGSPPQARPHGISAWSVGCLTQRSKGGGTGAARSGGHERSQAPGALCTRQPSRHEKGSQRLPPSKTNKARPRQRSKADVRPSPAPAHPLRCWKSGCGNCCAPCAPPNHRPSTQPASPATSAAPRPACPPSPPAPDR